MQKENRTLKRALDILQLIRSSDRPLTAKEVSVAMGLPASSTFDIIRTLFCEGYLEYGSAEQKSYVIGISAFEIGSAYIKKNSLFEVVSPYVQDLMRKSGATCFFAVVHKDKVIYMDKAEANSSIRTTAELGSRRNMYSTGLGKSILSCYSERRIHAMYDSTELTAYTPNTLTNVDDILRDCRATRDRGYAIDNSEGDDNVFCVACALRDYSDTPVGAISIATMSHIMTNELSSQLGCMVAKSAQEISRRLGYTREIYDGLFD